MGKLFIVFSFVSGDRPYSADREFAQQDSAGRIVYSLPRVAMRRASALQMFQDADAVVVAVQDRSKDCIHKLYRCIPRFEIQLPDPQQSINPLTDASVDLDADHGRIIFTYEGEPLICDSSGSFKERFKDEITRGEPINRYAVVCSLLQDDENFRTVLRSRTDSSLFDLVAAELYGSDGVRYMDIDDILLPPNHGLCLNPERDFVVTLRESRDEGIK